MDSGAITSEMVSGDLAWELTGDGEWFYVVHAKDAACLNGEEQFACDFHCYCPEDLEMEKLPYHVVRGIVDAVEQWIDGWEKSAWEPPGIPNAAQGMLL